MSRVDDLPAHQKATLQLLLKQGKSYDELGSTLNLAPSAVRERALDALDALGPDTAAGLAPARQDEISDYLLGQQRTAQRAATRTFLEGSEAGRAWARAVADALAPMAGDALPEIPAASAAAPSDEPGDALNAEAPDDAHLEPSSRLGGVLLLGGGAVVFVVLVALVVSRLFGGDDAAERTATDRPASTQDGTGTAASTATGPEGGVESQIAMTSTTSKAVAAAFIVQQPTGRQLAINGQDFSPTDKTFNYAVWLTKPPSTAVRLGYVGGGVKGTGADKGRLVTGANPDQIEAADPKAAATIRTALKNFYDYKQIIITREPAGADSTAPGAIVVSGAIVRP